MWDFLPIQASTFAGDIDFIIKLITGVVGVWLIASYIVFFYFILAYRKKKGKPAQYIPGTGKQVLWVLVPVFFVMLFDFGIDIVNHPIWVNIKEEIPETEQTVRITAKQWMWEFTYPGPDGLFGTDDDKKMINQLHVKVNSKTKFELTAADVLHSFSIPVFRLKQDAIPGRIISGWFEPIKTGNFDLQCAEICGMGHSVMAARVIVETAEEFDQFMTTQTKPAEKVRLASNSVESGLDSRGN